MLENFGNYGYLGVFVVLLAAGFGVPIPEELPVITAGVMVGHEDTSLRWYYMLPVCIAGVVIGDCVLYLIGRKWGRKLIETGWVKRKLLPPEKREQIEKNFHDHGIKVLLGARLLPGIRSPIFLMAGVLHFPFRKFLLADAIYAVPGVNLLFWTSYMLTDQVLVLFNKINEYKTIVFSHLLAGLVGALIAWYLVGRKVSTGEMPQVPNVIAKPAEAIGHAVAHAAHKVANVARGIHDSTPPEAKVEEKPPEPPPVVPPG
jgi:membrane protein DedA with SNARE-associated domain